MSNVLAQKFTFKKLIKFVYPSVIMMVFTSVYGVVDGIFVSNFAGKSAFAAVNLIMPILMGFASVGFMVGTGGAALVSKILGEGDRNRANRVFSLLIYTTLFLGLALTAVGEFTLKPLAILLKAEGEMLEDCVLYGAINLGGLTAIMLQNVFQSFFPVAEKPKLGLLFIVSAGLTNAALDAIFIAGFKWGLVGAALATVLGQCVGGIAPVFYFLFNRKGVLALGAAELRIKPVLKAFANGSSEMMTQLSLSIVNILYNYQLMRFVGENGVSAYGVIMYVSFIFCSIFIGYSIGVAPIIGFNFGAGRKDELRGVFKKSLVIIGIASALMLALALALNYPLPKIFVGYDEELFALTRRGFFICAFIFSVMGFNIFGSAFFTALNNGLVSAIISFLRTLVFQIICVFALPALFGTDGIWAANVAAELISVAVTVSFIVAMRKRYGYA